MTSKRYTLGDVSRSLTPEKRNEEWQGEWAVALVYRPLSNILTVPLLWLGVRADQVTLTGLVLAFSLPFIALGAGTEGYLAVGALAALIVTLDCVDGNIARVTQRVSIRGRYLDAVTDVITRACLFAALGILIDRGPAAMEWKPDIGLLLCLSGAILYLVARLSRGFAQRFAQFEDIRSATAKGFVDRVLFPLFSGFDWALPLLIILFGFLQLLSWLAIWLVIFGALDFLYTQITVLKRIS